MNNSNREQNNIMLLGAGFTTQNMGVWALSSGATNVIINRHPNAKIFYLDYNYVPESYGIKYKNISKQIELINIRFSKKVWLKNNIVRLLITAILLKIVGGAFKKRILARNRWLRKIDETEMFYSIAGGDSFSDIYGIGRLIYVALPQFLILLMNKPLVLLPQTIGPFKSYISKKIALRIMNGAQMVYSRDLESITEVQENLLAIKKLKFCYDVGFLLEPKIEENRLPRWLFDRDKNRPIVGLNVSGLLHIGGYTQNNMFSLKADYINLMHKIIKLFIEKYNTDVVLVPHVLGSAKNMESDTTACKEIFYNASEEIKKKIMIIEDGFDHQEIKAIIGSCNFFIGSRMHACIAALSQCIPAVGLAYSRKFKGVFSSIGIEDLVIDLTQHEADKIIELVNDRYKNRSVFRQKLERQIPEVKDKLLSI